jgi:CRISPR-associated endonuclease Csn1
MRQPYRLGLDVGTNSLGWCMLDLNRAGEPVGIRALGVRIYPDGRDPQTKESLAANRRLPRQQRRRRDRTLYRKERLMAALIRHGLMPREAAERKHLAALDPYALRARGLDEKLTLSEFARALLHLGQRRGFLSNRRAEKKEDDEKSGMRHGISQLSAQIAAARCRTIGEFLHKQRETGGTVRARPRREKNKNVWDMYPTRAMYVAEFDALWAAQSRHHPELSAAARDDIRRILFFQRPLKPVDPGRCTFEPSEQRAPEALPLYQEFRIRQDIAHLRIERLGQPPQALTVDQRDRIYEKLHQSKALSFDRIRVLAGLDSTARFSLESEKRTELKGDQTGVRLAHKEAFGKAWWKLAPERQNAIVEVLLAEENEERLLGIAQAEWGLSESAARAVADTALPDGYGRLGRTALGKIVAALRVLPAGKTYADAVKTADPAYHHSDFRDGELFDELPYYAEPLQRHVAFGTGNPADPPEKRDARLANPTVHIGLNQLRKIVNALIERYGPPEQISVELARALKQSRKERERIEREQAKNQDANERRRAQLAELRYLDTGENLLRLRLWEELNPASPHDRRCIYTGEQISIARLFSPEVEIEHILPFRRTLDNSPANRTVSLRRANRDKGNLSPFEAFGASPRGYDWTAVLARAENLPKNKRWRFAPDAMERFESEERDFLDRQLMETQYLSRLTREYLGKICNPDRVWVTPGKLTEMLRGKWGLNRLLSDHNLKDRTDHRHHVIDAFVVAVTDRALLQRVAAAADQEAERDRLIAEMPPPYPRFDFEDFRRRLNAVAVSYKPDHGIAGKLHDETAHGVIKAPAAWDGHTLVYRKALPDLNANEIERVRDPQLRARLGEIAKECGGDAPRLRKALEAVRDAAGRPIRHVRLLKTQADFRTIRHGPDGAFAKAYVPGENHHIDVVEQPDGTWKGVAVSVFDANTANGTPMPETSTQRLVMRVHKGDLLKLEHDGKPRIMRIVRLSISNNVLYLAEHNETGDLQRHHSNSDDPFRWLFANIGGLKGRNARRVTLDVLGRVNDPWPRTDPKHAARAPR